MLTKKERTIDKYMKAGAEMRLIKTLASRAFVDVDCLIKVSDQNKLRRVMIIIDEICSTAEDNMFRDHPQLSDEYINVFYGATNNRPINSVDAHVLEIAKDTADACTKEGI